MLPFGSNHDLYSTSNQMGRSNSAIPNYPPQSFAQTYEGYQENFSDLNPFSSQIAKSYSNFPNQTSPLFDASSILRCYSTAAIMHQPSDMPSATSMQQMGPMAPMAPMMQMPPLTQISPMTPMPLPIIPLEPISAPGSMPDPSMQMFMQPAMTYQPQMPFCSPPCFPPQQNNTVQKYEFADFQPDLCCIGRHLKRLRDRYRQQCAVPIS